MQFTEWMPHAWYQQAFEISKTKAALIHRTAEHLLSLYQRWCPDESATQIIGHLRRSNEERLRAIPDTMRFPELRGMDALVRAEWDGIRDGANLSEELLQVYVNKNFYYHRHILGKSAPHIRETGVGKCSYVYFKDSEFGPLLANNLDSSLDEPFGAPDWPALNEHLLFGRVSSGIHGDEISPEIFPVPVFRIVGRYCRTTKEAVELLDRYKEFWGPGNLILIDRNHHIALIEKSARRIGIRFAQDYGFITSMTAESPVFRKFLEECRTASLEARNLPNPCNDTAYWDYADKKRLLLKALIQENKTHPTFEALRSMIQYRGERGKIAFHGDPIPNSTTFTGYTLRTTIWILRENRAVWWATDGKKPSFESQPQPITFPEEIPWN